MIIRKRVSAHWKHLDSTLVQQLEQTLQAVAVEAPQAGVRCVTPQMWRGAACAYGQGLPSGDPAHTRDLMTPAHAASRCMSALPQSMSEADQRNQVGHEGQPCLQLAGRSAWSAAADSYRPVLLRLHYISVIPARLLAAGGQLLTPLSQWPSSRCQPTSGLTCCPGCCASPTARRQRSARLL